MKLKFFCLIIFLSISFVSQAENLKIISLKPNITEILFALGMESQIVGVTKYCNYPAQAKNKAIVADYINIDVEKILALKPDLIFTSEENSSKKEILFLEQHGFKVYRQPYSTWPQVLKAILEIGKAVQREVMAQNLVLQMQNKFAELKTQYANKIPQKIVYVVGRNPLVVAGSNNWFDELSQFGLINVFAGSSIPYPKPSMEQLVASRADVIIDLAMGSEAEFKAAALFWQQIPSLQAVKNNKVIVLDMNEVRASNRLATAYEYLLKRIHDPR